MLFDCGKTCEEDLQVHDEHVVNSANDPSSLEFISNHEGVIIVTLNLLIQSFLAACVCTVNEVRNETEHPDILILIIG